MRDIETGMQEAVLVDLKDTGKNDDNLSIDLSTFQRKLMIQGLHAPNKKRELGIDEKKIDENDLKPTKMDSMAETIVPAMT